MKMFNKLGLLALVAPLVSAFTITLPPNINSGGSVTIGWTVGAGDPDTFSIELTNSLFNDDFAIANNVDASTLSITLTIPIVQSGGGYTIAFVNIGNINQVFASTPSFSIGPTVTSSTSGSTPSTATSGTGTGTGTTAGAITSTQTGVTTTANSLPVTSSVSTGATTSGSSSSSASASATPSTAAAVSRLALTNAGGYAALLLSAVAGAIAVAL